MSAPVVAVFIGVLVTLLAIGLALGAGGPRARLRKRAEALKRQRTSGAGSRGPTMATSVKRKGGRSLPIIEELAKRFLPRQSSLRDRLAQTGREIALGTYALACVGVGLFVFAFVWLFFGLPATLAAPMALIAGLGLPHVAVGVLGGRRKAKFVATLPDAIDLIVRRLKSGLPVTKSIAAVGREMTEPLAGEFRRVSDSVRLGRALEEVLWETAHRFRTAEFNFFVISLSIQRETGGNLAETLGNLSDILRRRRQMRMKVRALSSEARTSAYILGSLPFIMFGIVYTMNPDYAGQLFTDPRGLVLLGAGLLSLLIGATVMAKMVRFEI